jgi:TRAP-type C4-dicarboxylate transport system permease small subunit
MQSLGAWLRRRAENVAAAMLAVMFAAFVIQIVFRYFFNLPTGWTTELTVVAWLWLVLWGSAFVLGEKEEIRFDLIYSAVGRACASAWRSCARWRSSACTAHRCKPRSTTSAS